MMKKLSFAVLLTAALVAAFFTGCSEQPEKPISPVSPHEVMSSIIVDYEFEDITLIAGQQTDVGNVTAEVVDNTMCITFQVDGGYNLVEAQLSLVDYDELQTLLGTNVAPGQLDYNTDDGDGTFVPGDGGSWTICVPLVDFGVGYDLCDLELYIIAHAVVGTETAWGQGPAFNGDDPGNWAMYCPITLVCGGDDDPENEEETAWAYDCYTENDIPVNAHCFSDIDTLGSNNWGWTNGMYGPGYYEFDLYAGAGQCDLDNGYLVGFVTLDYADGTAFVTYNTYCDFTLEEVHLWVGDEILPRNRKGNLTNAPGQFPNSAYLGGETYYDFTITGLTGDIYIAAHAVVEGNYYNYDCDAVSVCECDEWIVYGSNLNGGTDPLDDAIYAYDLNAQTQTLVFDPTPVDDDQNYPNANAYDPDEQRIYCGTSDGLFFYYDVDDVVWQQLTTNENFGTMAGGSWYNGKFYYIQNSTNRLYEVTIVGTGATRTQIGTVPTSNGYGDIAFDPDNPGVFVGSAGGVWYWYDVTDNGSGTLTNLDWDGDPDNPNDFSGHRQLAYGSDGVLYGVVATSGKFYTVDVDYIAETVSQTFYWDSPYTFTDLASGPQCQ